jgi:hypothetical protein
MKVKGFGWALGAGFGLVLDGGSVGQVLGGPQIVGFGGPCHGICARGGVVGVVDVYERELLAGQCECRAAFDVYGHGHRRRLQRAADNAVRDGRLLPGRSGRFNGSSPCTLSGTGGSAQCSATFTPSGPEAGGNTTILAGYNGDSVHLDSSGTTTVTVNPSSDVTCADRAASIVGTARADRLAGTRKRDVINGRRGNDRINAGGGGDLVCAGPGNDRVLGGRGNDRLFGQTGNDTRSGAPAARS